MGELKRKNLLTQRTLLLKTLNLLVQNGQLAKQAFEEQWIEAEDRPEKDGRLLCKPS